MTKRPFCRIDGVIARDANTAVIFRRGPSRLCKLLIWDLNSDEITGGQWLQGRVYTKRCDVSPDGKHLVIAAANYSVSHRKKNQATVSDLRMTDGWTAISKPPYFTAVALWFTGCAWNGGGIWNTNEELWINNCPVFWEPSVLPPSLVKVVPLSLGRSENEPLCSLKLLQRGWNLCPAPISRLSEVGDAILPLGEYVVTRPMATLDELSDRLQALHQCWTAHRGNSVVAFEKAFAGGTARYEQRGLTGCYALIDDRRTVRWIRRAEGLQHPWLDVDKRGRVVYGDEGCLWAWEGFPKGEPKLVADLNGNLFEGFATPEWARNW